MTDKAKTRRITIELSEAQYAQLQLLATYDEMSPQQKIIQGIQGSFLALIEAPGFDGWIEQGCPILSETSAPEPGWQLQVVR